MNEMPNLIIILSGKRKSGKDYIAQLLLNGFKEYGEIKRLSEPLKEIYAKDHDLDFHRLLDSSNYKENYRLALILWGEEQRLKNPYIFCQKVMSEVNKPILIISDARRKTDFEYFQKELKKKVVYIRIEATEETRIKRGWKFVNGIDDVKSECDLDDIDYWDYTLKNDVDGSDLKKNIQNIVDMGMKYASLKNDI